MEHVLIAGVSTRAAAASAARAGFRVTAIDAFADLDQAPGVRALSVVRDFGMTFTAPAAARASRTVTCGAVAYLASFENHPSAVATLARDRVLLGNPPDVLRRVRDPIRVMRELAERGCSVPAVHAGEPEPDDSPWLLKPRASGGGRRVTPWQRGRPVGRGWFLQQRIDGTPGSVVFVAANGCAVPLGLSRQLCGDPAFGATGFRYCGSVLVTPLKRAWPASLVERAWQLAAAAASAFRLRGVNGIDMVAAGSVPYPIEVNPRWCASMELVERAFGLSVFGAHVAACTTGALPTWDLAAAAPGPCRAWGKAIVFARRAVAVGDTRPWLAENHLADVPRPGERIPPGRPVCTVFADAEDDRSCYEALVARARWVYAQLSAWECAVA